MEAKEMKIVRYGDPAMFAFSKPPELEQPVVREILDAVKKTGDMAVIAYTKRFDNVELTETEVSKGEIKEAYNKVDGEVIMALTKAAENIRAFAQAQREQVTDLRLEKDGIVLGQKVMPLERVGCYVPGGSYPLPSSALMSVIPAKVAGVKEVIVCSPKMQPVTLVAADIAGADRIFKIGGVQAVAAMAYGTRSVPRVDKIVGPGNVYVTAAKRDVFGQVGIDFVAGPSELVIIADGSADPRFIAADILAQAEHDVLARVCLITDCEETAAKASAEVERQLESLPTASIAKQSVAKGLVIVVKNMEQAIEVANRFAPEHLEVQVSDPQAVVPKLTNYGSLFIGKYSAEVFGDYCSGPNHILPTGGAARYTGGLSVLTFLKVLTYQEATTKGATGLAETAATLAQIEGLIGHKRSAELRRE
jgi:histidinol dehydrogenase